ncbi:TetR/AcrR family transcriptional regulator [Sneathiella sp.]|uniref:TetR/AcrR family transcriptional regulator n=1 Tax=Sneathiella sp. TaxID=1964365 RepID=UPI0025E5F590|nr:TetR/AcrR family transcriptional regulator [Sneathiella sp.]
MATTDKQKTRGDSLRAFKRQHILSAAKRLFDARGMEGLNMRDIAEEAGYSLGAAYAYFRTKEEIQYELLSIILGDLTRQLRSASAFGHSKRSAQSPFLFFIKYFQDHPEEMQLTLLVLSGLGNESAQIPSQASATLNSRLLALMGMLANGLHQSGETSATAAQEETIDFVAFLLGLLMLENGGRLALLNQQPQEMVDRYGKRMLLRNTKQE